MRLLLSLLISLVLGVSVHGASGSDTPPTKITSSNSTVTVVFDQPGHTYDLSVATSGGATNGIQQLNGHGTNTAINQLTVVNGVTTDNANVTNEAKFGTATLYPDGSFSNNVRYPNSPIFRAGTGLPLGPPPNPVIATNDGVGVLNGTYIYCYTEGDVTGRSSPSPFTTNVAALNTVRVVTPIQRRGTLDRRLWRTTAGTTNFFLLFDFNADKGYLQTVFDDNVPDGSLGAPIGNTADTSALYEFVVNDTVKFLCSRPDVSIPTADLGVFTGDPSIYGSFSIDTYAQIYSRSLLGPCFGGLKTGESDQAFRIEHVSTNTSGIQHDVFSIFPNGRVLMTNDNTIPGEPYALEIAGGGMFVDAGGIYVRGITNELSAPTSIGFPSWEDSTLNVVNSVPGRHANIRAIGNNGGVNGLFWGHSSTNALNSLGWDSASGAADILLYAYESTNASAQSFSGNNRPIRIRGEPGIGDLTIGIMSSGSAIANTDITFNQAFRIFDNGGNGGVTIGTNTTTPGGSSLRVEGSLITLGNQLTEGTASFGNLVVSGDAEVSIGTITAGVGYTNRTAALETRNTGNNIFFGFPSGAYTSSIGNDGGAGDAWISFYQYASNNNQMAYSGTVNAPAKIHARKITGDILFESSPLGVTDNEVTTNEVGFVVYGGGTAATAGVRVGDYQAAPGAGNLSVQNSTSTPHLTNIVDIASTTAEAIKLSGTNVNVIGELTADTLDATNGIKSAGTSYIGFGSGAINLTGRLAVTHITNVADFASTTAIAVSLSGTNVSAIGALAAPIVTATNQLHLPYVTASKVLIANAQSDATNAVLTTGTIPVASTSGISDGPMQVGAVTNVAFNGGITADNVHATNGVTSGGFVLKQVSLTQGVSPLVDSTNQTLDFAQGMYQIWTLTNDVCLNAFSGSPSAATIKFRANGGNRNVLISTNWMPLNVQGGTANGSYYQFILTNGTQFSTLSAWATGANATNVAAVWANF